MAITISLLALLATFYQLYLQRVHNEKSLKTLVQIDLLDRDKLIFVHIQNNGVGPLIIDKLTFFKNNQRYSSIEDCLDLNPKLYQHIAITEAVKKVILPGNYLEVFSTRLAEKADDKEVEDVREQLSVLRLKVEGRDIYNNKVTAERDLHWFLRHHVS
ncbi:hypothetical protein AHMF7605_20855 [Adhaeribacter arboris]|uniref:Uncharacterized protein n=1 Tax=Adhaeribacter arboris TaxID=2072846 RepID=A0A2T2YJY1_9BACT|nr:hypothetical protein [Adhaeribacter arboris]PSR55775.1 hypothetical protein AHMF7605_20855 [Adhaeribacter arboris]